MQLTEMQQVLREQGIDVIQRAEHRFSHTIMEPRQKRRHRSVAIQPPAHVEVIRGSALDPTNPAKAALARDISRL